MSGWQEPQGFIMGLFDWVKGEKKKNNLEEAKSMGEDFGRQIGEKIDHYLETRVETVTVNLLEVFKGQLETVYDEPEHDPKDIAAIEFKIFGEQIVKFNEEMGQEILDYLTEEFEVLDELGESEALIENIVDLIVNRLEPHIQILLSGAKVLFDSKIEEIENSATPT